MNLKENEWARRYMRRIGGRKRIKENTAYAYILISTKFFYYYSIESVAGILYLRQLPK